MKRSFFTIAALFFTAPFLLAFTDAEADDQDAVSDKEADATFLYMKRETCDLLMDIYYPKEGSEIMYNGKKKPVILFAFGGGFAFGDRKKPNDVIWFNEMSRRGYTVISIDYRLGMKGVRRAAGLGFFNQINSAIHLAVEDIFAATDFLIKNEADLGIDASNIVLAGSSAGAISVLQADYELCNRTDYAAELPENFKYAGIISFAGAILSSKGQPAYTLSSPAPTLFLHGTKDKVVNYKQIRFFKLGFFGSDKLARRFKHYGYNYRVLRFNGNGHEIANSEMQNLNETEDFIQKNIMDGKMDIVDALIDKPEIEKGTNYGNLDELYGEQE